jgi:Zn finger protein HypA/HybF involved in hydrogenase expression
MPAKISASQFNEEVSLIGNIKLSTPQEYLGVHHYYHWECLHCSNKWTAPFQRVRSGKHGCPECGSKRVGNKNVISEQQFLDRLNERNVENSPVEYVSGYLGMTKKCVFRCMACLNEWNASPKTIVRGHGCPECAKSKVSGHLYTHAEFISRINDANHKRGSIIMPVEETAYIGYRNKMNFVCEEGHIWNTLPETIMNGYGCPYCSGTASRKTVDAIAQITEKWPLLQIDGELKDILGRRETFAVKCENGHTWKATYERLMNGNYCPHCYGNAKDSQEVFIAKVAAVSPTIEVLGEYVNSSTKVLVKCLSCSHEWSSMGTTLKNGYGCPNCARNKKYSKIAIKWLRQIEQELGYEIKHAESSGEYFVPGTKFRADGYDAKTNTIYEFYGDYWHGNPQIHESDGYNELAEMTFGELYERTIDREAQLRSNGYNIVTIWECDFKENE